MSGSRPSWTKLGLDLVSLRLFIATLEEGGITAAAGREGMSASAVSRRISELEARSGVVLLERHEHGVIATAAGQRLADQLALVFDHLDAIAVELDAVRGGRVGTVRLHVYTSANTSDLPAILARFLACHSQITIGIEELTSIEVMHSVRTGTADLGIVSGTRPADGLKMIPWRTDRLVALVPSGHSLADRSAVGLQDLLDEPFIAMQREGALIALYRHHARLLGSELRERAYATSFSSVQRLVAAGLGVAILPAPALLSCAEPDGPRVIPLEEPWAYHPIVLCLRKADRLSAAAKLVLDHLLNSAATSSAAGR